MVAMEPLANSSDPSPARVIEPVHVASAADLMSRMASFDEPPVIEIDPVLASDAAVTRLSAPRMLLPMLRASSLVRVPPIASGCRRWDRRRNRYWCRR